MTNIELIIRLNMLKECYDTQKAIQYLIDSFIKQGNQQMIKDDSGYHFPANEISESDFRSCFNTALSEVDLERTTETDKELNDIVDLCYNHDYNEFLVIVHSMKQEG